MLCSVTTYVLVQKTRKIRRARSNERPTPGPGPGPLFSTLAGLPCRAHVPNRPWRNPARRPDSNLNICGWPCSLQASLYGVKLKWGGGCARMGCAIHSVLCPTFFPPLSPLPGYHVIYTLACSVLGQYVYSQTWYSREYKVCQGCGRVWWICAVIIQD